MKILVAIEGSQASDKALAWAIDFSKVNDALLDVVTVIEDVDHGLDMPRAVSEAVNNELIGQAKKIAEQAKILARGLGCDIEPTVLSGSTVQEVILDRAKANGSDLIVVGSRGRKGINRFVMGSVASRVVRHAPCSVTVVR